jgi:hypothetical protein
MLEFINNCMMSITKAVVRVFKQDDARGALDAKVNARMSAKGKVGCGPSLALDHSVSPRTKYTTVRDIHTFTSPFFG